MKTLAQSDLTSREFRVLIAVLYTTYTKPHVEKITTSILESITQISRSNLLKTIKKLSQKHMVVIWKSSGRWLLQLQPLNTWRSTISTHQDDQDLPSIDGVSHEPEIPYLSEVKGTTFETSIQKNPSIWKSILAKFPIHEVIENLKKIDTLEQEGKLQLTQRLSYLLKVLENGGFEISGESLPEEVMKKIDALKELETAYYSRGLRYRQWLLLPPEDRKFWVAKARNYLIQKGFAQEILDRYPKAIESLAIRLFVQRAEAKGKGNE